jgi:hypothetical protein
MSAQLTNKKSSVSFSKILSGKVEDIPWSGPLLTAVGIGLLGIIAYPLSGFSSTGVPVQSDGCGDRRAHYTSGFIDLSGCGAWDSGAVRLRRVIVIKGLMHREGEGLTAPSPGITSRLRVVFGYA